MTSPSGAEGRKGAATFLRLVRYLKPYRALAALALLSLVAMAGLDVLRPLLIMAVVDRVVMAGDMSRLLPLVGAILGVSLAHAGATFALTYLRRLTGEQVIYDLRNQLYAHLHHLDSRFHDRSRTGELMSRTGTDVQAVRRLMGFGLITMVRIAVSFGFVLAAAVSVSPPLTGILLLTGPGLYLTVRSFRRQIKPAFRAIHEQNATLSAVLQENVTGVRVVRAFGQEAAEERRFGAENWETLERHVHAAAVRARHAPFMDFWGFLSRVILLVAGGWLVIEGHLTIGAFVAFDGYLARMMQPVRELHGLVDMLGEGLASGDRIFELLDTRPAITTPAAACVPPPGPAEVRCEGVSLSYDGLWALRDVDLTVRAGEVVAVVGPTGSGKSSLMYLLNRTYDPGRGRVLLAGRDVRDYALQELRRRVAVIPQESFLFSTTVYENIAYGRPDATPSEVEAAARRARAHEFIAGLPRGYDTVVGERGAGLSGGQRQRITIARAILMRPAVLIIDDATSALDTETEFLIWEALGEVVRESTTFVVAQRLATIGHADRIIVLHDGRIVEDGPHAALLARGGLYARMYRTQVEASSGGPRAAEVLLPRCEGRGA